jgi:hypothetical protein
MRIAWCALLVGLGLALAAPPAAAQSVTAAVIIDMPPPGTGTSRPLSFGTRVAGQTVDTGPGSEANAASAKFQWTGIAKNVSFTVQFSAVPLQQGATTITPDYAPGGSHYGTFCIRRGTTACGDANTRTGTFNASSAWSENTNNTGPGNNDRVVEIWIGARIVIPASAPSGSYTGSLTATLTIN